MSFLPFVRLWTALAALASAAGWSLSYLHELNGTGYVIFGGLALAGLFLARRELTRGWQPLSWHRIRRRFSRPLPLAFAGLAALAFLGGLLYPPNNYDALTYRLPRVLHWLQQEQWHWIHTSNNRMNDRSAGFEWLMAPIILVTKSDRALFLINYLPFLLLPGLIFSVFTRLGVTARVAWYWMWLLPTGYNFLLQAGSLANDAFAAAFAIAMVDFALRSAKSRRLGEVWFSLLAAALLTGAKSGNLPLLLPWFIAILPVARQLSSRPVASLFIILLCVLVSFLPTAMLNSLYCGDWTGLTLEKTNISVKNPLVGIIGNSFVLLTSNFVPTLFPLAGWWNQSALTWLPDKIVALLLANFEGNFYKLGEIPTEEAAGLGFGLSCLLAATVLTALLWRKSQPGAPLTWTRRALLAAPYGSLLFFFAKSGMMTLARIVSAYYPLLLPALLGHHSAGKLVRHRWWRRAVYVVLVLALMTLVLTPARPLWPAQTILARLDTDSSQPALKRLKSVYLVYASRADPLAAARAALPDDCTVVGFVGAGDDSEISFWRPFGRRRAEHILLGDPPDQIRARGIQCAVVGELFLYVNHQTIDTWLARNHGTLLATTTATMTVSGGTWPWYIVRLAPGSNAPPASPAAPPAGL